MLQRQPLDFSFLQHVMEEGRTWFHADQSRWSSDPSIALGQEFPLAVDEEEQQWPRVRRCIFRRPLIAPQILPRIALRPAPSMAPPITLVVASPMAPPVVPVVAKALVEPLHHETKRGRNLFGANSFELNPPSCNPRHLSLPIYPPMATGVPDRPRLLVENPNLPWFGDYIHGQSRVLHQIL